MVEITIVYINVLSKTTKRGYICNNFFSYEALEGIGKGYLEEKFL
jgi:hypothetical protein